MAAAAALTELFKKMPVQVQKFMLTDPLIRGSFNLRNFLGFAQGGPIPGTGSRDSVPIMAQPGEYVLSRRMVDQFGGIPRLESVRQGGAAGTGAPITVNVYNPVPEPTSASLPRAIRKTAQLTGAGR